MDMEQEDLAVGGLEALGFPQPVAGSSRQAGQFPRPADPDEPPPVNVNDALFQEATRVLRDAGSRLSPSQVDPIYEGYRQQLARVRQAQEARARQIEQYRQTLAGQRPDPAEKWFRVAAAIGAPTRTGTFGEAFANAAGVYGQSRERERTERQTREAVAGKLAAEEASALVADETALTGLQGRIDQAEADRRAVSMDPSRRYRNVAGVGLVDLWQADGRGQPRVVVPTYDSEKLRAKIYESVTQRFRAREAAGERFASPQALEQAIQQETNTATERILGMAITGRVEEASQVLRDLQAGIVPGSPRTQPAAPAPAGSAVPTTPTTAQPTANPATPATIPPTAGWWNSALPPQIPIPSRTMSTPASEAASKAEGEAGIKRYDEIRAQADLGRTALASMPALDSKATGVAAPVAAAFGNFLASIGVPADQSRLIQSATDIRRFGAAVNNLNLATRLPQKGTQTNSDNVIISATLPAITNAPALNAAITGLMSATYQRAIDRQNFIDSLRNRGVSMMEAENRWNKLIDETPMVARINTPTGPGLATFYDYMTRARAPGSAVRSEVLRTLPANERNNPSVVDAAVEAKALEIWRKQARR
ncbi:hypothetical protein UFOVP435_12 [uncultured Caudovirales phage]|uniref:Uncharacterized protein n=1 Tax=uncultured Caudovirales phage TaxID=2100421 RepID=A0A6J5MCG8_9CAUD|nr:hypothetical protein UFOVP435_12 [uncultured Caudovirales phage]